MFPTNPFSIFLFEQLGLLHPLHTDDPSKPGMRDPGMSRADSGIRTQSFMVNHVKNQLSSVKAQLLELAQKDDLTTEDLAKKLELENRESSLKKDLQSFTRERVSMTQRKNEGQDSSAQGSSLLGKRSGDNLNNESKK